MAGFYDFVKGRADVGIRNLEQNSNDKVAADGSLLCGRCGEKKRKILDFPNPLPGDPDHKTPMLVACACKCDEERERQEKERKQTEADMASIRNLKKASLMDKKFENATFDKLDVDEANKKNFGLSKRYATAFGKMVENNQGLLFMGQTGRGKSYMAAAIANHLLSHHVPVVMTSTVKLLEAIEGRKETEADIIARVNRARLVILDDLGTERGTDYSLEKVYNIVDSRYRRKMPMIVTTNLTMREMELEQDLRYKRIFSRILEVCYPMNFGGPDRRIGIAKQRYANMEKLLNGE